jgi:hypothetical protein
VHSEANISSSNARVCDRKVVSLLLSIPIAALHTFASACPPADATLPPLKHTSDPSMSYQSPTNHGAPEFPPASSAAGGGMGGAADNGVTSPVKRHGPRGDGNDNHHVAPGRYESPNHYRAEMPVPRSQRIAQQQAALQQQQQHAPGASTPPDMEGPGGYQPAHHVQPPPPPPYGNAPPPPYDPTAGPPPPHHHHHHHHGMHHGMHHHHHHPGNHHHHHHDDVMGGGGMPPPPPSYEAHVAHLPPSSRNASPFLGRDGHGSGHFGSGHGTPSGRYGTPGADVPAGSRFRHDPYSPGSSRVATPNRREPMSPSGFGPSH